MLELDQQAFSFFPHSGLLYCHFLFTLVNRFVPMLYFMVLFFSVHGRSVCDGHGWSYLGRGINIDGHVYTVGVFFFLCLSM